MKGSREEDIGRIFGGFSLKDIGRRVSPPEDIGGWLPRARERVEDIGGWVVPAGLTAGINRRLPTLSNPPTLYHFTTCS